MKKISLSISTVLILTGFSFAQGPMMDSDTSDGGGCPKMGMGMGMGMLMPRVVANLPDGSVLVMSGRQLYKYDQNLKLLNQVTVPVDTTTMQQMRQMCPRSSGSQQQQQQQQKPPKQQPGTPQQKRQ